MVMGSVRSDQGSIEVVKCRGDTRGKVASMQYTTHPRVSTFRTSREYDGLSLSGFRYGMFV